MLITYEFNVNNFPIRDTYPQFDTILYVIKKISFD